MREKSLGKIRGWLIIYIIWVVWCAIYALFTNGQTLWVIYNVVPDLLPGACTVFALVLIFYSYYSIMLIKLIYKKTGIISKIKLFIICTPILNAILPAIFVLVIFNAHQLMATTELLAMAYSPEIIGNIIGASIIAAIWYLYFCRSMRVLAIWPER